MSEVINSTVCDDPMNDHLTDRLMDKLSQAIKAHDCRQFSYSTGGLVGDSISKRLFRYNFGKKILGIELKTEDSVALARNINSIVDALNAEPLDIELSLSWRWDTANPMKNGKPRYCTVYVLNISYTDKERSFDANSAKAARIRTLPGVCVVDHPIVGSSLFQYQEERDICCFASYAWESDGFSVTCETLKDVDQVFALFSGFKIQRSEVKDDFWRVRVTIDNQVLDY